MKKTIFQNKHWDISHDYLERIGFINMWNFTWKYMLSHKEIIFMKNNIYYFENEKDKKPKLFWNVNYKTIEDKLADLHNLLS